jgi:hypothetical protein
MLRTNIPMTVWMEQPDGAIETAIAMLVEQDEEDRGSYEGDDTGLRNSDGSWSG